MIRIVRTLRRRASFVPQLEHALSPSWHEWNPYYAQRLSKFQQFASEYNGRLQQQKLATRLPNARVQVSYEGVSQFIEVDAVPYESSPMMLFKHIRSQLQLPETADESCLLAHVNGSHWWDAHRPLDESVLQSVRGSPVRIVMHPVCASSVATRSHFWHSSAHVLGQSIERMFSHPESPYTVYLDDGPATDHGFFYDASVFRQGVPLEYGFSTAEDFPHLQKIADALCSGKGDRFERIEVSLAQAKEVFSTNPHKMGFLSKLSPEDTITLYRCGSFVDLCRGPHVPYTNHIKTLSLSSVSAVQTSGDAPSVQRIYGVSYRSKAEQKLIETQRAEAEKRDHRVIGKQQQLFMFHTASPGSAFFLPHGMRIFTALQDSLRKEYRLRGYQEVMTPILFSSELWKQSGHWDFYRDDMFFLEQSKEPSHVNPTGEALPAHEMVGLKPMNCPSHCLIFAAFTRSYRELPLRIADFSPLHRNEPSGSLSGLTRLRRFHQDDAHIFCRPDQIAQEIGDCLSFVLSVYQRLAFDVNRDVTFRLSTRPDKFVGDPALWDTAEATLQSILQATGKHWVVAEKDGAFYGPKIDILLRDALGRQHQCGTVQLDFQMPRRFQLKYSSDSGTEETPVMVHRAILGSFERLLAVLTEHLGGRWPLWMSPRQVVVLPLSKAHVAYAERVKEALRVDDSIKWVDVDMRDETLNRKIRDAQTSQANYILVVGPQEESTGTVHVRHREKGVLGAMNVEELRQKVVHEIKEFTNV